MKTIKINELPEAEKALAEDLVMIEQSGIIKTITLSKLLNSKIAKEQKGVYTYEHS